MTDFKEIAKQLRQPSGDVGKQVGLNMNISNAPMYQWALESLSLKPGDQVLEIGMGNGAFIKDLFAKEDTIIYTGCDFSETMVAEATQLNNDLMQSGKVTFTLASINSLPYPSEHFNSIFTINTIYFWDDPATELPEIKRVLKDDGILLIGLRPESTMKDLPFTGYNFRLYDSEKTTALLNEHGFRVIQCKEEPEPDLQMGPATIKMKTLIIVAEKMI
jgi:ubiquinone/menaquinone biosynthesis C-methylase UbiE